MIEQTDMVVTEWDYHPPEREINDQEEVMSLTSLEVMRKRASTKKGIAFRFSCRFVLDENTILQFAGEDSYVIDFEDIVDKNELQTMIRNSFSKFKDKFELRKLNTVLHNRSISPLAESKINFDTILPLLA